MAKQARPVYLDDEDIDWLNKSPAFKLQDEVRQMVKDLRKQFPQGLRTIKQLL